MPVIIQQGDKTIIAMPGAVIGLSDEENEKIQNTQIEYYKKKGDYVTLSLIDKAKQKLKDYADELLSAWDVH